MHFHDGLEGIVKKHFSTLESAIVFVGRFQGREGALVNAGEFQCLHPQRRRLVAELPRGRCVRLRACPQMLLQGRLITLPQRALTSHDVRLQPQPPFKVWLGKTGRPQSSHCPCENSMRRWGDTLPRSRLGSVLIYRTVADGRHLHSCGGCEEWEMSTR